MNSFRDIDYWKLNESLSVVHAAMLASDLEPGSIVFKDKNDVASGYFRFKSDNDYEGNYFTSSPYVAVFTAIRSAVLSNKLNANISHIARDAPYYGRVRDFLDSGEDFINYDTIVVTNGAVLKSNVSENEASWGRQASVIYVKEPDWNQTQVNVDELKEWMGKRGFHPSFFFPEGSVEGFRDKAHPRYSPKLACAVGAWEAVERSKPNKSVKGTVTEWVRANAVMFDMVEADGVPSASAVEEVAKVVNWDTKGGANRTGGEVIDLSVNYSQPPIDNYKQMNNLTGQKGAFVIDEDDSDIPF